MERTRAPNARDAGITALVVVFLGAGIAFTLFHPRMADTPKVVRLFLAGLIGLFAWTMAEPLASSLFMRDERGKRVWILGLPNRAPAAIDELMLHHAAAGSAENACLLLRVMAQQSESSLAAWRRVMTVLADENDDDAGTIVMLALGLTEFAPHPDVPFTANHRGQYLIGLGSIERAEAHQHDHEKSFEDEKYRAIYHLGIAAQEPEGDQEREAGWSYPVAARAAIARAERMAHVE